MTLKYKMYRQTCNKKLSTATEFQNQVSLFQSEQSGRQTYKKGHSRTYLTGNGFC